MESGSSCFGGDMSEKVDPVLTLARELVKKANLGRPSTLRRALGGTGKILWGTGRIAGQGLEGLIYPVAFLGGGAAALKYMSDNGLLEEAARAISQLRGG